MVHGNQATNVRVHVQVKGTESELKADGSILRCPMWTADNRPRYNRDKLRYPSDLTEVLSR